MGPTYVAISAEQFDLLLYAIYGAAMAICFCIGWSCHEGVAK